MRLGSVWVALASAVAIFAAACTESGDIGAPCVLVKSNGDGGTIPILYSEIGAGVDVVSFGSIECEDFVCVRHRYAQLGPEETSASPARGQCSRDCVPTNASSCEGLSGEANRTAGPYTCRSLVLDPASLADVCDDPNPPPICGITEQSSFCAQGAIAPNAKSLDGGP